MKGGDVAVSFEIRSVKRQDALNCVDGHDGNEARIIDLDALDPYCPPQFLSMRDRSPECLNVWQEGQ